MEQRNLILAVVVSVVILIGSQMLMTWLYPAPPPAPAPAPAEQTTAPATTGNGTAPLGAPTVGGTNTATPAPATAETDALLSRPEALGRSPRVAIASPHVTGSIALRGGRVDDLVLNDYHEEVDPSSPKIILLSPAGAKDAYYADYGWVADAPGVALPGADTLWQADGDKLSPDRPVTLRWDNGQGLTFYRSFALDADYMFTVTQRVENNGSAPVTLYPYGLIARHGTPHLLNFYILHEGMLGVLNGTLEEIDYSDVADQGQMPFQSTGGWLGITDKYWLVALVPDQAQPIAARFGHTTQNGTDLYQTDYRGDALAIAPGGSGESTGHLFAGAKEVRLLDHYKDTVGIPLFDRAVDFGWFYFLTKPIFYVLDFLNRHIGNFGVAILALTVMIRLLMYPLANKSFRAMNKMKGLTPEMTKLRERFKEDKPRMQQELMALYKREKVNPAAGCLPILVQIPVFFALYKVLFVTIEMRHAPFFGWIQDLSAKDPTSYLNLFGLAPWGVPQLGALDVVSLGIWPLIMGVTMWLQQKMNPAPPDPVQARIMSILPIVFTFMLAHFPAGLVIYWAWNNTLSIAQQWMLKRRMEQKT